MTEKEQEALNALVSRAANAKQLSDQITVLMAWTVERRDKQIRLESRYYLEPKSGEPKYPEDFEVSMIVELGRVTMIDQLRSQLSSLLGIPVQDLTATAVVALSPADESSLVQF